MAKRRQVTVPLRCPKCGQVGTATWEENEPDALVAGLQSSLQGVSKGFYWRTGVSYRGNPEIMCERCGAAQPS